MKNPKYKIGDKVIFNSQIFIVVDVHCSSTQTYWYFIKEYDKRTSIGKVITDKFLKPYKK